MSGNHYFNTFTWEGAANRYASGAIHEPNLLSMNGDIYQRCPQQHDFRALRDDIDRRVREEQQRKN
jgi:hypothetical protein